MTACSKWRDELLDAALSRSASPDLQAHLDACAACAAEFSELQVAGAKMDAALVELRAPQGPSENFLATVQQQIHARPSVGSRRVVWRLAAAAVLLIAVAGAAVWQARLRQDRELIAAASVISEWRSPTDGLLRSPAQFLQASPRVGETYFPIDTTAAKARGTQIRRRS